MYLLGVAPSQLPPGLFAVWDAAKSTNPTNPVTAAILRKESSEEEQVGKKNRNILPVGCGWLHEL